MADDLTYQHGMQWLDAAVTRENLLREIEGLRAALVEKDAEIARLKGDVSWWKYLAHD